MNYKAGGLVSLTQDDYPGLGKYFVQIWSYGTGPSGDEVVARVYGETPERAREKAEQLVDSMNYMQAVDDALVIRYLGVASGSAKKDLNKIIDWEVDVSLDPTVSSRAEELIQKGRDEVLSQGRTTVADERAALADLLEYVDRNTCTHEDTHRGGAIWTICDGCGMMWADDKGGFVPHQDAPAVAAARAALANAPVDGGRCETFDAWLSELNLCKGFGVDNISLERNGSYVSLVDLLKEAWESGVVSREISPLVETWRKDADQARDCGRIAEAATLEACADELIQSRKNNLIFTECVFSGKAPEGFSDWFQWINSPTKKGAFIRAVTETDWNCSQCGKLEKGVVQFSCKN